MAEGYCVKCKDKKPIADAQEVVMKNGRQAVKGRCPSCGVGMFKILGGKPVTEPEDVPTVAVIDGGLSREGLGAVDPALLVAANGVPPARTEGAAAGGTGAGGTGATAGSEPAGGAEEPSSP